MLPKLFGRPVDNTILSNLNLEICQWSIMDAENEAKDLKQRWKCTTLTLWKWGSLDVKITFAENLTSWKSSRRDMCREAWTGLECKFRRLHWQTGRNYVTAAKNLWKEAVLNALSQTKCSFSGPILPVFMLISFARQNAGYWRLIKRHLRLQNSSHLSLLLNSYLHSETQLKSLSPPGTK